MIRVSAAGSVRILVAALPLATATLLPGQNLVHNGDFEDVAAPACHFNLPNARLPGVLNHATAFGSGQEIDVMSDPAGCTFGSPPLSGVTKVGIATSSLERFDAFSLSLVTPTVRGATYTLQLSVEAWTARPGLEIGAVEVGLSNSANSFGDLIASYTGSTGTWTTATRSFVAPVRANFLTLRNDTRRLSWNHIDNLSLTAGNCQQQMGFQGPGNAQASVCGAGLARGETSTLTVVDAPAFGVGALVVSLPGGGNLPFAGGTLVSFGRVVATAPIQASASGSVSWPLIGQRAVTDLVLQGVFFDPAQTTSFAITQAVLARYGR